ncbi:UTP--glucose-1-phosphate uridylyltransferase [Rhizobium halophytocola]|uniref:UTP--glucose-1-phosphate uridylyltransferase n=1 Tax=Rhizobium halophytocola TaxID=735519 RepID=A0ABS4E4S4_9HYPH|nr:UTP--glucose-1-phosphate uridylyltransferase [Rhizobium halophytocola]MBP1852959.1 UTP--glucose-1-phosphate uridylyltransferase [Rhizobium halophytocola]
MTKFQPVRKAVIPVAGNGTRFLPATKSMPKEMLTIVDRPVVQYAVDEAMAAGIEHIIFVTSRNKTAIEDYFDTTPDLTSSLTRAGKTAQVDLLEKMLPIAGTVSYTRQQSPLGLGHAVWCARELVGNEPFALLLPDMVSFGPQGCMAGLMDLYDEVGGNVIAVEECAPHETSSYGIVGIGNKVEHGFEVSDMVEKPDPAVAPSNYYLNGRYILQPEIFGLLASQERGAGNEIQLTDSMQRLAEQQAFHAHPYGGRTFDCGSKRGFIEANVAFAMLRAELGEDLAQSIQDLVAGHQQAVRAA